MTNNDKLVAALRYCISTPNGVINCKGCPFFGSGIDCQNKLHADAADAIEALQAEIRESMQRCAECGDELAHQMPKRGKWVLSYWTNAHILYRCSVCGNEMLTSPDYVKKHKYCFSCGAKMEAQE